MKYDFDIEEAFKIQGCGKEYYKLIDDQDKEYKKEMVYIVKPDIKTKYIDMVLSIW